MDLALNKDFILEKKRNGKKVFKITTRLLTRNLILTKILSQVLRHILSSTIIKERSLKKIMIKRKIKK